MRQVLDAQSGPCSCWGLILNHLHKDNVPASSLSCLPTDSSSTPEICFDQAQVFFSSQPNNYKLIWLLPLNINISAFACCLICLSVWILIVTQEQVMKQNFRWSFCRGSNTVRTTFQRRCQSRCGTLRWSSSMKITGQGLKGWEEGPFPRNMVWLCSPKGGPILAPCSKSSGKIGFWVSCWHTVRVSLPSPHLR